MRMNGYWFMAIIAGALLAIMIFINGQLARYTSPTWASLVAHGIGGITAVIIFGLIRGTKIEMKLSQIPWWAFLGGIPGAFVVVLASITVNSRIGLSGTLSLSLLGQVAFSLAVDCMGWFQMPKKAPTFKDFFQVLFIMSGTAVIIFFAR